MKTPREQTVSLTIGAGSGVVTAIEQFLVGGTGAGPTTDPSTVTLTPDAAPASGATRPDVVAAAAYLTESLQHTSGFVSGLLLAGHGGELVLYSQWRVDGSAPVDVFPAAWSIAPAVPDLTRVDARTYAVDFTAPEPVSPVTLSGTPRAHFGVFTVDPGRQEELLVRCRRHAPDSIGVPGLAAINFHRSLDGGRVVNLGLWEEFSDFAALLERKGFEEGAEYWLGVAGFRPHFFDVAAVTQGSRQEEQA